MKKYIKPATRWAEVEIEALIAESPKGGLSNGDYVGNQKPSDDNEDNCFSKEFGSSSLWDKEW